MPACCMQKGSKEPTFLFIQNSRLAGLTSTSGCYLIRSSQDYVFSFPSMQTACFRVWTSSCGEAVSSQLGWKHKPNHNCSKIILKGLSVGSFVCAGTGWTGLTGTNCCWLNLPSISFSLRPEHNGCMRLFNLRSDFFSMPLWDWAGWADLHRFVSPLSLCYKQIKTISQVSLGQIMKQIIKKEIKFKEKHRSIL